MKLIVTEMQIADLVKAAVKLAIFRHGLATDDDSTMGEESAELIAADTWNALRGIDTCCEEPIPEWEAIQP